MNSKRANHNDDYDDADQPVPQIPYRRDRTPSIVVQSLGLSFHKDSNINESIEGDENASDHSNSSDDPKSSTSETDEQQNNDNFDSNSGPSGKGSMSSLQNSSSPGLSSPVRGIRVNSKQSSPIVGAGRRMSLNIGSTAPRRQSLTVEGLSATFVNPNAKDNSGYASGNATGSLRNKAALKPGHSLMGWIRLASQAEDLSGTGGKIIEVTPEELAKHDKESDCWVALKDNVYNVTTYLQYHPGGVEELMRGAGQDATELFNEVHRWVNYESILAKCLVGPYRLDSPLTPVSRAKFAAMTTTTDGNNKEPLNNKSSVLAARKDPTVANKPPRRQSIALTVPSPNKYQSLLLGTQSSTNVNHIQQPPRYVIMQDKSSITLKIQNFTTLPTIRSRHIICDLNEQTELHVSIILSFDWLYRVHLKLNQKLTYDLAAEISNDDNLIIVQLNKQEQGIWNKIGTSLDLNDSLCEMTLADKYFRSCKLANKTQITHDTYLFEFTLDNTLMYVPIGWHVLIREHSSTATATAAADTNQEDQRLHKNYTPVLPSPIDNNGKLDETGFMRRLCFIIKIYSNGMLTSKLDALNIGDQIDISDYQVVDFDVEQLCRTPRHWIIFAAGTGITPFCRIISFLLSQEDDLVKSVNLIFFNKTQKDIIWKEKFDQLSKSQENRFAITYVLSEEPEFGTNWSGKRGRINRDIFASCVDKYNPDELQMLACGPRPFTQQTKALATDLNLHEKLYIFHG